MSDFSLHLKQGHGSDEWSFVVRDHTGSPRYARRFFPDRLTAERSGKAAMRKLQTDHMWSAKPRVKIAPPSTVKPKRLLFPISVFRSVFSSRFTHRALRNSAAANDNPGLGAPISWRVGLPVVREHLARGLSLRDALRAADENLRLAGSNARPETAALLTSLYDWYARAMSAESQAVRRH